MTTSLISVTDDSFETDVIDNDKTVVVDFWAPWCSPCKALAPVLEEIADEHGDRLTIAKLDIEENPATFKRYAVRSIPTLLVFEGGEVVRTIVGGKAKDALLEDLADHLGA